MLVGRACINLRGLLPNIYIYFMSEDKTEDTKEGAIPVDYAIMSHFGAKLTKEERPKAEELLQTILANYATSAERRPLYFPEQLSAEMRQIVHNFADLLGLSHESKGPKGCRILVVSRRTVLPMEFQEKRKGVDANSFFDVPNAVTEIQVEENTATSLRLSWAAPDCNNRPITMYMLEIDHEGEHRMTNSPGPFATLQDLQPDTLYKIVVRAQNSEGLGYVEAPVFVRTMGKEGGGAYAWGLMDNNQLAFGSQADSELKLSGESVPRPTALQSLGNSVSAICSHMAGAGLLADGTVFRFGSILLPISGANGEVDQTKKYIAVTKEEEGKVTGVRSEPYQVSFPLKGKTFVTQIACGEMFGLALSCTGQVFSWGSNGHGELGIGSAFECAYAVEPMLVKFPEPKKTFICEAACGANHAIARSLKGEVFVWGKRQAYYSKEYEENALFDASTFVKQPEPRLVKETDIQGEAARVFAGGDSCGIVNSDGELLCFGENDMCQAGMGSKFPGYFHLPQRVEAFRKDNGRKVLELSVGFAHMLAIVQQKEKTSVFAWGLNKKGQCGVPSTVGKDFVEFPTEIKETGMLPFEKTVRRKSHRGGGGGRTS